MPVLVLHAIMTPLFLLVCPFNKFKARSAEIVKLKRTSSVGYNFLIAPLTENLLKNGQTAASTGLELTPKCFDSQLL